MLSSFPRVGLFVTLWTVACQDSVHGFFGQEYWRGLPCPHPGIFPTQVLIREPMSLMSPALVGGFFTTRATCETHNSWAL